MMKIYNIDQYGSNFSPEVSDVKDQNYFYENLGIFFEFLLYFRTIKSSKKATRNVYWRGSVCKIFVFFKSECP